MTPDRHNFIFLSDLGGVIGVSLITGILVFINILLHYEVMTLLNAVLMRLKFLARIRILLLMFGLIITHLVEIWIFEAGYYFLDGREGFGSIVGPVQEGALDYVYFSSVTYTTLGYGDLVPVGPIRLLSAIEGLSGLLLVAWSSSFTFIEMHRFWRQR